MSDAKNSSAHACTGMMALVAFAKSSENLEKAQNAFKKLEDSDTMVTRTQLANNGIRIVNIKQHPTEPSKVEVVIASEYTGSISILESSIKKIWTIDTSHIGYTPYHPSYEI
jgi:hypothetical protein